MKHLTIKQNGFIRHSTRVIISVSLFVSFTAIGQSSNTYTGYNEVVNNYDSDNSNGFIGDVKSNCIEESVHSEESEESVHSEESEESGHNEESGYSEEIEQSASNEYSDDIAPENTGYIPLVYSGAAITMGAHSTIIGNIQAVAAVTLGEAAKLNGCLLAGAAVTIDKDGKVFGDVTAGEATTLGATSSINGDLSAAGTVFIGAESEVSGDLTSGSDLTLDALATVGGNATAANSVTLGAYARVGKDELEGNVKAVNGPIVLGQNASVKGNAEAGAIISFGMNAIVGGEQKEFFIFKDSINDVKGEVVNKKDEFTHKQKDLADRISAAYNELDTTLAMNRELDSGIYHASALSTTANIILTFTGNGSEVPEEWLFNVDTYISFGAKLTIKLDDNVAPGSTIIFNSGSYTTIGANSNIIGTIFAGTYITTGENTTISGVLGDCGGMFATNGAITMGAHSTFGALECWQAE